MARFAAEAVLVEEAATATVVVSRYPPNTCKGGIVEKSQGKLEVPTGSTTGKNRRGGDYRQPGFDDPSKQGEKGYAVRIVSYHVRI